MTTRREELLRATSEAASMLSRFPVGKRTSFDIIRAATELGVPVLFRPLSGLWGAAITAGNNQRGILVTTKLGLAVQRFTLAHEIGHILLGHDTSLDEAIGFAGRFGPNTRPTAEIAADTFASELLAPRSLMLAASQRHGWTRQALTDPEIVYQLSLRLGVSFQAACWALAAHKITPKTTAQRLQEQPVKELKLALTSSAMIQNPWADVWKLTQGDSGSFIEAGPDDTFIVHFEENASAGYLWELVDSGPNAKVLDERSNVGSFYGAPTSRVVYLQFETPGEKRLVFEHRRPWNRKTTARIDITIDNYGKEQGGFARQVRHQALAAVSG